MCDPTDWVKYPNVRFATRNAFCFLYLGNSAESGEGG
jgi:hypothetical protein